jgi:hypothetical protein
VADRKKKALPAPIRLDKDEGALGLVIKRVGKPPRVFNPFRDDFGARVITATSALRLVEGEQDRDPAVIAKRDGLLLIDASQLDAVEIRVAGLRFVFDESGIGIFRGSREVAGLGLGEE